MKYASHPKILRETTQRMQCWTVTHNTVLTHSAFQALYQSSRYPLAQNYEVDCSVPRCPWGSEKFYDFCKATWQIVGKKKKNWIKDFRCKKQMLFPPKLIHSSSGLFSITWEPLASWNKGEGSGEALEELRWIYLPQPHSIEQKHHHRSLIIIWLQYLINIIITY